MRCGDGARSGRLDRVCLLSREVEAELLCGRCKPRTLPCEAHLAEHSLQVLEAREGVFVAIVGEVEELGADPSKQVFQVFSFPQAPQHHIRWQELDSPGEYLHRPDRI